MEKAPTSFGLCSKKSEYAELSYEKQCLVRAAQDHFDEVVIIDSKDVLYFFERGQQRPRLLYQDKDIANLNVLLIRSTGGRQASTAMLAHTLAAFGCNLVDPIERFSIGYSSKLLSTISRFQRGVGSNSYIAFGVQNALILLGHMSISPKSPLLFKPFAGKKGKGIVPFSSRQEAAAFVQQIEVGDFGLELPFLFQTLEHFVEEYRVLVVNGNVLGMAQKIRPENVLTANAAQGAAFLKADQPDIADFVRTYVSPEGILGVDVARDDEGALHLIEANRAPMWQAFEKVTGINVAAEIFKKIAG